MTGADIYNRALLSLGYADTQTLKSKSLVAVNQVYDELYNSAYGEYKPLKALSNEINLPERIATNALVFGVAEKLALGEGDGELQQYFAKLYDRAKARITVVDKVVDVFGGIV